MHLQSKEGMKCAHVYSVSIVMFICRHIEDSLGSVATQINFFIHNLAQLKFSSPQAPPTLLSFVPQVFLIPCTYDIQLKVCACFSIALHSIF